MHADQVVVEEVIVRDLIRQQFPQWSALPVKRLRTTGTVNAIFRIGDDLVARLPLQRRETTAVRTDLEREAAAADEFAAVSPFPAPVVVAIGESSTSYPMPWSIQTWLPGHDALTEDPADSSGFAEDLARLVAALRAHDTGGRRFQGQGRGGHLPDHDEWLEKCFERSTGLLAVSRLRQLWAELRTLPREDDDAMSHGDLTPANLLVRDGRVSGVLDTGGFAAADPALDLVAAWHLLDAGPREVMRNALGCSDLQWRRGVAWAFQQAMGLVWYYRETNPAMAGWGRRTLTRIQQAEGDEAVAQ